MNIFACKLGVGLLAATVAMNVAAGEVTLVVDGVKPGEGQVRIGFYREGDAFDDDPPHGIVVEGEAEQVSTRMETLPPGTYAVAAFQDLDGTESLTRNFFGFPREPFGFSREARARFGPPEFEDAAVDLGSDPVTVRISLQ